MSKAELQAELLWFEALLDSILDGQMADAVQAIQAAIKLRRRQIRESDG